MITMMETIKQKLKKHKETLIMCLFFFWIILLALGTLAAVYNAESILNWPIWRIPGSS